MTSNKNIPLLDPKSSRPQYIYDGHSAPCIFLLYFPHAEVPASPSTCKKYMGKVCTVIMQKVLQEHSKLHWQQHYHDQMEKALPRKHCYLLHRLFSPSSACQFSVEQSLQYHSPSYFQITNLLVHSPIYFLLLLSHIRGNFLQKTDIFEMWRKPKHSWETHAVMGYVPTPHKVGFEPSCLSCKRLAQTAAPLWPPRPHLKIVP